MGLDNIPAVLACERAGTAVKVLSTHTESGETIDCVATIEAHGCPWHRDLGDEPGAVQGIFGTFCWYRGKSAMGMIALLPDENQHPPNQGFYGPDDEGLNPDQCRELADWMADRGEIWSRVANTDIADHYDSATEAEREVAHRDAVERWRYAVAWLRWVAAECDGTVAWW